MLNAFKAVATFVQRLFAPKNDDFKAALIADLGIER